MNKESASTNHGIDDTPFGLTNSGNDVVKVPVEMKDHSKDLPLKETKQVRTTLEKEVDAEIISETCCVPKKKRGRPSKKHVVVDLAKEGSDTTVKEFYCSTCRERYLERSLMKIGAGKGRNALFCPNCQKSMGFSDVAADEKIAELQKNPNQK